MPIGGGDDARRNADCDYDFVVVVVDDNNMDMDVDSTLAPRTEAR